jgi:hypothetical protein
VSIIAFAILHRSCIRNLHHASCDGVTVVWESSMHDNMDFWVSVLSCVFDRVFAATSSRCEAISVSSSCVMKCGTYW